MIQLNKQKEQNKNNANSSSTEEEIFRKVLYEVFNQKGTDNVFFKAVYGEFEIFHLMSLDELATFCVKQNFHIGENMRLKKLYYIVHINGLYDINSDYFKTFTKSMFQAWPKNLYASYIRKKNSLHSTQSSGQALTAPAPLQQIPTDFYLKSIESLIKMANDNSSKYDVLMKLFNDNSTKQDAFMKSVDDKNEVFKKSYKTDAEKNY